MEGDKHFVIKRVCDYFSVPVEELLSPKKTDSVVNARALTAFLLRNYLNFSYAAIGETLGKDHTSIIHLIKSPRCERIVSSVDPYAFLGSEVPKRKSIRDAGFYAVETKYGGKWGRLFAIRGSKCEIPQCGFDDVVEIHHLISKKAGGTDAFTNVLILCPNHHRMIHHEILKLNPLHFPSLHIPAGLALPVEIAELSPERTPQ